MISVFIYCKLEIQNLKFSSICAQGGVAWTAWFAGEERGEGEETAAAAGSQPHTLFSHHTARGPAASQGEGHVHCV